MAIDFADNIHLVWVNQQEVWNDKDRQWDHYSQLLYLLFNSQSNQWETATTVAENSEDEFSFFALAIDSQDDLHLISRELLFLGTNSYGKIQYRKRTLNGWSEIGELASDEIQGDAPSFVIDNQNNLHPVWYRTYFNQCLSEIKYLKYEPSSSTSTDFWDKSDNSCSQLVIASLSITLDS